MSHARIVLQAVGSQDAFLTKNSKHTHFKKTHRNHTQFGLDWSIINANDKNLRDYASPNSSHYFRLENNGDLINEIYLRIKINIDDGWSKSNFGNYETIFNIIDNVEFLYNDKTLTKLTSDFIFSYFEINYNEAEKKNLVDMFSYDKLSTHSDEEYIHLTIPLPLWFHKSPGLAFPMWALNNPNVGVNVNLKNFSKTTNVVNDIELLVNFTQISSIEKQQFANKPLEYLIESVEQLDNSALTPEKQSKKIMVTKSHYIRYFMWNIQNTLKNNFNFLDDLENASISFNGNDLINNAPSTFYKSVSRYMHFKSACNMGLDNNNGDVDENSLNPVYTYSFCRDPTTKKLSGYFTSEKFNNVTFDLKIKERLGISRALNIYMVKHNIMRISNGYLDILVN